ncbi:SRPBCC family protein [Reinekea marinisedimentorum]|uniref:Polyketide cyclase/dehydrase/lipid transport protein n=1 Tax=Reinekea marinisedimentorum TaxID=230495 RepID=A0A4R3HT70_9GAMM|nr:SRPBCC family protein [Reinekea marinisedimentorum]TCS35673.1 polyketide cyclase/dehydrase/lipid transport protein [Reinekea marinisedimentorum]
MKIQAQCQINAPKDEVFKAFSDLSNLEHNVQAITKVEILTSAEEIGVGTKFKETRVMFGKEASEVMEITGFSPSDHIREEAHSNGMHYISDWRFSEDNGQTKVTIDFSGQANSFFAKVTSALFFFMAGSMKKAFEKDMNDLKVKLEMNS